MFLEIKKYIKKVISNPKKVFWKLDRIFLRGYIKKCRNAHKERIWAAEEKFRVEHPEEYYDRWSEAHRHCFPIITTQSYALRDVVMSQFVNGIYKFYDIAVRLLAIEQFYGKNSIGYELYRKMQSASGFDWIPRFEKLIKSYENEGYDAANPIELDDHLTLMDGSHRLALAIYYNQEFLPATLYKNDRDRLWDYNWFWEMNYSPEECHLIHSRTRELFDSCRYDFVGVIWPPAFHLRDEIINDLSSYLHDAYYPPLQLSDCQVVSYFDVRLSKLDFSGFLRAMYHTDVMTEEGMQYKINCMVNCMPDKCNDFSVRIFYLKLLNPEITRNPKNNTAQSAQIAKIKKAIRNRYKDKVNNYEYDVVMHISDNYIQSKFCRLAVETSKDISKVMHGLNESYNYAVVKAEKRLAPDFPYYYYYSDVDMLIQEGKMNEAADFIYVELKKIYGEIDWWSVNKETRNDGTMMVNVFLRDFRMLCLHLQTADHFSASLSFNQACLSARVKSANGQYYVLPPAYDMIIRAYEYVKKPHKDWHYQYIKSHIDEYDEVLLKNAYDLNPDMYNKINELIKSIQ